MAENKDVGQGCGGCGCGCKPEKEEAGNGCPIGKAAEPTGALLARSAIEEMNKPVEAEEKPQELCVAEQDVDAFIEECDNSGKNPLEVIQRIAKDNGFTLADDKVPREKEYVFKLLKAVLKKVLVGFLSYVVDQYGLGAVQSVIGMLKGEGGNSENKGDEQDPKFARGNVPQGKVIRLVPVRVGYAIAL